MVATWRMCYCSPAGRRWLICGPSLVDTGRTGRVQRHALTDALGIAHAREDVNPAPRAVSRLPKVTVTASGAGPADVDISDDPDDVVAYDVSRVPVGVTLSRIGRAFAVDTTPAEEQCCDASVLVAAAAAGGVSFVQKGGVGSLYAGSLPEMMAVRKERLRGALVGGR